MKYHDDMAEAELYDFQAELDAEEETGADIRAEEDRNRASFEASLLDSCYRHECRAIEHCDDELCLCPCHPAAEAKDQADMYDEMNSNYYHDVMPRGGFNR